MGSTPRLFINEHITPRRPFPQITPTDRGLDVVIKLQQQIRAQQRRNATAAAAEGGHAGGCATRTRKTKAERAQERLARRLRQLQVLLNQVGCGQICMYVRTKSVSLYKHMRAHPLLFLIVQAGFVVLGRSVFLFLASYFPCLLSVTARLLDSGVPDPEPALLVLLFVAGSVGPPFLQGVVLLQVRRGRIHD